MTHLCLENEDKSVFSRLGQDNDDSKSAGVFKRLGEPVVTTTTKELSKKPERRQKRKAVSPSRSSSSDDSGTPPRSSKKVTIRRKHVLDRLGPEAQDSDKEKSLKSGIAKSSYRKSVLHRLGRTPDPDESSSGEEADNSSSSEEEARPKVVFDSKLKPKRIRLSTSDNFVVTKVLKPTKERQVSNVMTRLGRNVSSSSKNSSSVTLRTQSTRRTSAPSSILRVTKPLAMDSEPRTNTRSSQSQRTLIASGRRNLQPKKEPGLHRVLAMDKEESKVAGVRRKLQRRATSQNAAAVKRTLAMDAEKSSSVVKRLEMRKNVIKLKPSSLASKSLLSLQAQSTSQNIRQRLSKTSQSKPISSNRVSSTTSAGIFKRERKSNVFDRLGAK